MSYLQKLTKLRFLFFFFTIQTQILSQNYFDININQKKNDSWFSKFNNNGVNIASTNFGINYNEVINSKVKYQIKLNIISGSIFLNESFINYNYKKNHNLKIGRYYRDFSLYLDDNLSSGSLLISQNSRPMPKIGLYGKIYFKRNNNYFFDYGISHSVLSENEFYNEAPFIHEKFLYLNRAFNDILLSVGLVHEAIWAGSTYKDGKQPSTFEDFFRVFRASHGSDNALQTDQINALGNHLGIWDFLIKYNTTSAIINLYYQHIFEDNSGFEFSNSYDGLWGISIENNSSKILLEYLDTSNQSKDSKYGIDRYYFHEVYQSGWSQRGFGIGNPHISFIDNIPVKVVHLGVQSKFSKNITVSAKATRKINFQDDLNYILNFRKDLLKFSISSSIVNSRYSKNDLVLNLTYLF